MKNSALKKEQVKKNIIFRILSGQYPLAGRIPPERELCTTLDVSRMTVRAAVDNLIAEGILERDGRRGTIIKQVPHNDMIDNRKKPGSILFIYFSSIKGHPIAQWGASARIYHGLEQFTDKHDLGLLVQSGENFLRQPAIHDSISGIIVGGSRLEERLPQLMKLGMPVVVVDALPYTVRVDAVCADFYEAGIHAARKVAEHGYKNPLLLTLRYEEEDFIQSSFQSAQKGFRDFLAASSIAIHQHIVDYRELVGNEHFKLDIDKVLREKKVDCIIDCSNITDTCNIQTLPVINTSGMGKNDTDKDNYMPISFDMERIGYLAAQRLYERMQNPCLEPIRYLIPVNI